MLKPLYEAPINSPQDIIEKDHTLFGNVGKNEKKHLLHLFFKEKCKI